MLRNTVFALATIATVTAAAAVPASAHWKGHGFWRGGLGFGSVVVIEESCYRLWRGVLVNVCR